MSEVKWVRNWLVSLYAATTLRMENEIMMQSYCEE